ncbi:GPI anchored cell wall protein [Grosmannia clavigera kw1407]|uniref:GPI anchored cell wall protein n=1 Tax=Grosmannia clavigera (strain kw1407 / UAMH 11150) TaxID=655863 RepID=F0XDJ5_GROCL|nr:GPI anchored cell wall protein [Grosmannia clavigera kw1407]EFX04250.1 GPI anchored cell wall protein [Grosmannia clavigera kw1407]
MHLGRALLGLPASLVLSLAVLAQADEQRQQPRQQHKPVAVRKMMDEGEKFFPEQYFAFEEADDHSSSSSSSSKSLGQLGSFSERRYRPPVQLRPPTNGSSPMPPPFLVPFAVHEEDYDYETELELEPAHADSALSPRAALARLQGRDWSCPTGTASCSAIGYPYSCCASGETCYEIENVGLGPVGCCPTGESCSGSVTTCGAGTTACSEADGGGCCIAGFKELPSTASAASSRPAASELLWLAAVVAVLAGSHLS